MMYKNLFERKYIGDMSIKNSVYMTAMTTGFAGKDGQPTEQLLRYYEERAKGGVGMIVTEIFKVNNDHGVSLGNQLYALDFNNIPALAQMTARVHKYGTRIVAQLNHGGANNDPALNGGRIVAPSAVASAAGIMPEPLTLDQIEELKQQFIMTAAMCKAADFDGVELHCAHGYLLCSFLSAGTNQRTDQYGGSLENRCRLPIEILQGIKAVCGPDFPVLVRFSVDEYDPSHAESIKLDEGVEIAKMLEAAGADALDVSCGNYFTPYGENMEPYSYAQGWRKGNTLAVKKAVNIPVLGMNTIKEPEFAEQLLEEGVCDMVGVGRGHIADPEWCKKAYEGRSDEIRKCLGCMYCFESLLSIGYARCSCNPRMGREASLTEPPVKDGKGRKIAVVGGGAAGLQVASLLASRDFDVTLFEASDKLGGALNLAGVTAPYKDKILKLRDTLILEAEKSGVKFKMNTKGTVENVAEITPEAVFLATGALPVKPALSGLDRENVVMAEDVIKGKAHPKGKVAVIGSGLTGLETAELISSTGDAEKIWLVDMLPQLGAGIYPAVFVDVLRHISADTEQMPGHKLEGVYDDGVHLTKCDTGEEVVVQADSVVLSLGLKTDRKTVKAFEDAFNRVVVLGEANKAPGRIAVSISDAYINAYGFEPIA